jgi:hypothetical protein
MAEESKAGGARAGWRAAAAALLLLFGVLNVALRFGGRVAISRRRGSIMLPWSGRARRDAAGAGHRQA